MDKDGVIFFKSKARSKDISIVKKSVGFGYGVDEFEQLLKLVGDTYGDNIAIENGAPKNTIVFTIEQTLETIVRFNLGNIGLLSVLDSWSVVSSGRSYITLGEIALLVKKIVISRNPEKKEEGFFEFLKDNVGGVLESKMHDEIEYLGLVTPTCGKSLDTNIFWKANEILNNLWDVELAKVEVEKGVKHAAVRDVARHLIAGVAATGLIAGELVHETCALCVATLAGSSTKQVAGGEEEGGTILTMSRLQFDWTVCRVVYLCAQAGGGSEEIGEGVVEEMYEVVLELIKLDLAQKEIEEREKNEAEKAGVVAPPMSQETLFQVRTVFEVYSEPSVVTEEESVVSEVSYIQFLSDTGIMQGENAADDADGELQVSRVEAIELFRINVSTKSSTLAPEGHALCFEDFYTALHCIALIATKDIEEDVALPALLERALAGL
jgi:hypothetical protein